MQPLSGIKVIDFSTLTPGPIATLILAEAGAEVIKIEPRQGGEALRNFGPFAAGESLTFALLNRGKRSLTIDLKDAQEREALEPLLAEADVLVEQFRPGVMERLGLGYQVLAARHPALIYCSITGYGATGPKAQKAGHDLNYLGDSGILALSRGTDDAPTVPPALVADLAGGSYPAVINILLALRQRDQSGKGCHLDIAMTENVLPFAFIALAELAKRQDPSGNGEGLLTGGSPRYRLYATADRKMAAVAALEEKFWQTFCNLAALPLTAGIDDVADRIAAFPADHWEQLFLQGDCCCTIVKDIAEAKSDPHLVERGIWDQSLKTAQGETVSALPVPVVPQFRGKVEQSIAAPQLGEGNADLL